MNSNHGVRYQNEWIAPMRSKNFLARAFLATAVVGSMSFSVGTASAVISRTCLDGTKLVDFKQCQIVEAQESFAAHVRAP